MSSLQDQTHLFLMTTILFNFIVQLVFSAIAYSVQQFIKVNDIRTSDNGSVDG